MQSQVIVETNKGSDIRHHLQVFFWGALIVGTVFLAGTMNEDQDVRAEEQAKPLQTPIEDWHGNVRRSGGGG